MKGRGSVVIAVVCMAVLGGAPHVVRPSGAADVEIELPPGSERPSRTPGFGFEQHPLDATSSPIHGPAVPYDPAFIFPFVTDVGTPAGTSRVGLSAWTSPSTALGPSGAGLDEINGWLGFGITWTWGGPAPHVKR